MTQLVRDTIFLYILTLNENIVMNLRHHYKIINTVLVYTWKHLKNVLEKVLCMRDSLTPPRQHFDFE